MNPSIRRRLLVALLSTTLGAWTVIAVSSYLDIRYQIDQLFDAQLAQSARVLLALNSVNLEKKPDATGKPDKSPDLPGSNERLFGHSDENKVAFQVWIQPDKLALRSPNAPDFPLSDREYGFKDKEVFGHHWRVFSLPDDRSSMVVQVGERNDLRRALTHTIALRTLLPIIIALPLLAAVIWIGVGRAMAPLIKLAKQVENRAPAHLQPVESYGVPAEAKPLVDSLNRLFHRLERAFDSERRFTADAAHELRTPLAGLKAQAQVALRSSSEVNRQKALRLLEQGVDRATHLVQQLLTLARLDPDHELTETHSVDLANIAQYARRDLELVAREKQIDLAVGETFSWSVQGHADALAILLRNLVDNAVRYTPEGGKVEISMVHEPACVLLRISDSGPGIPPEEREKVFKRFYRALGTEAPGSGLGLSIVQRIAELHRATLILGVSIYNGLQVDVSFPVQPGSDI